MYILLSIPFLGCAIYYIALEKILDCFTEVAKEEYLFNEEKAGIWLDVAMVTYYIGWPVIVLARVLSRLRG